MFKGIDVSYAQGNINWDALNHSEVQFAFIRAGYGSSPAKKDNQFENNYAGCKKNNIPCGTYWYSYAETASEARLEAEDCLKTLAGKTFEYPIAFDIEEKLCRDNATAICKAFCETLEGAKYFVTIYSYASFLTSFISEEVRKKYDIWVAHYDVKEPDYPGKYGIWQYSSKGRISGYSGNVDMDYAYKDYPRIIKEAGLNGFDKG